MNKYEKDSLLLIDSHIHINHLDELRFFFQSAFNNFSIFNHKLTNSKNFIGVLFLTEVRDYNFFKILYDNTDSFSKQLGYKIERTLEDNSLLVSYDENKIILIAGQQIITAENLEILALGTINKFEYGKDFSATINWIKKEKAIPVIPWGVGKWFGKRGRIVEDFIQNNTEIFLGDNSGRPLFWPTPKLFKEGINKKIYTLRGTDPLPIKTQVKKVGRFGFYFFSHIDMRYPFLNLKELIYSLKGNPNNFGHLENPLRFFKDQFILNFKQRISK
ncbi:MAG TPA: hypothetical protein VLN45_08110 [Ignavibacteriaceae bacterium]|nr:hypothetical protein [Ignavibacteriaceae bacterium]